MNYFELLRAIMNHGELVTVKNQSIKELCHVQLEIPPGENFYSWPEHRPLGKLLDYWRHELAWYLSGSRKGDYITPHSKCWHKILNPDGTLNSNYGYLVFYNRAKHPFFRGVYVAPFFWALKCLLDDKNSRQAIVTYNTGKYNYFSNKDYICTQHQHFLIRNNRLNCYIALRSSDAIWGLAYNIPWWSVVQQNLRLHLIQKYPKLSLGEIKVTIYSSHLYERHFDLAEKLAQKEPIKNYFELNSKLPCVGGLRGKKPEFYFDRFETIFTLK